MKIILPVLLLAATNTEAAEQSLQFDQLLASQKGRHFLLTTLLEKHYKPLSTPRYQGKVQFQLPSILGGPLVPTSYPCCQLDNVPSGSGSLSIADVKYYLEREDILRFRRGTSLNDFSQEAKKAVNKLASFINRDEGEERQFSHMLSVAASVKELVNQDLFAKTIITIFLRRNDVGNTVPPATEILGASFFPAKLKEQANGLPISLRSSFDIEKEIVIDWSDPQYATYPDDEPEKALWYIREDPEVNSHHWFWHILFGDLEFYNKDELQHRRGELFWYLHNQVCNRYNMERLSNGMDLVEPFAPEHWVNPIPLGYDPKLGDTTKNFLPPRPNNVMWTGGAETNVEMNRRAREISNSIEKGYMTDPQGRKVPLKYKNGRDEGVIPLGATIETDPLRTVNNETYGDLHNGGHGFMATAGLHPQLIEAGFKSAIGNTATECRDPLLYRWHAYIDGVFAEYKKKLPEYSDKDLAFNQISIGDVGVFSYPEDDNTVSGRTYRKNKLFSHMENGDVGYFGLDGDETHDERVRVKYKRLNHSPFVYRFNVRNSGKPVQGMVRIFLAADVGTPTMVEMDKFIWTFGGGETFFERSYDDSSSVPRKPRGLYEIQDVSLNSIDFDSLNSDIIEYSGCGWAKHLLVPKGSPEGFQVKILVVISKLLPGDDAATTDWKTVSGLSHTLCGAPGAKFPDSRPMAFPFDRYRGFENIMAGRANMKIVPITIYHRGECRTDRDCSDLSGCDRHEGRCNSQLLTDLRSAGPDIISFPVKSKPLEVGRSSPDEQTTGTLFSPEAINYCMKNNSSPKLKEKTHHQISSVEECQKVCISQEGCAYFEWEGKKTKNCKIYTDVIFEPKIGKQSLSGPAFCNKKKNKLPSGTSQGCWKKNRKPSLVFLKIWNNVASAEKCQKLCQEDNACESLEWVRSTNLGYSDCYAFAVQYVKKTDSWSGPVDC